MRFDSNLLRRCWFLAGPTACGKTAVGVELAARLNAEIVSLDSMSLYRGMDIGTAKPSAAERSRVPHHLIDVIEPHEEYSLAEYVAAAEQACREIVSRGRVPLFVGGTGLYLRAVLRGVFEGPAADWDVRGRLEQLAATDSTRPVLHERLQHLDPASATRLHPNDTRRLIRALEVFELTGQTLSSLQCESPLPGDERPPHVYWLEPPRDWLHDRINRRVEAMFAAGLIDEVKHLLTAERPLSRTARQALGYKETIDYLAGSPNTTPQNLIELIQTRTRQFAKRQHTWFRNLEECHVISVSGTESPVELAKRLAP
ncbi:MAG: tRNA (adenosine(37)-N6)-dimethylallyltransferase MiaA [Planctomycetales bacterium]|nr:tRNA (adenosine(37)-N6)-dimethylallyltransferase MiaA [Planctomycetales bacterium]